MVLIGNNAAGISNKKESFFRLIDKFLPGVFFIQESKARSKNKVVHNEYIMFETVRQNKNGGGLLTAIHKSLDPVCVSEVVEDEILVVEGKIGNENCRFINAYGPQEVNTKENIEAKKSFFNSSDYEIKRCIISGSFLCLELDANSKLGSKVIPGDKHEESENGKELKRIVDDNDLVVVNGSNKCQGLITRRRNTVRGMEESTIDFFIVCPRLFVMIEKMIIHEQRFLSLTKYASRGGKRSIKDSDHLILEMVVNSSWNSKLNEENNRIEIYDYINEESFQRFQELTDNNEYLRLRNDQLKKVL